MTVKCRVFWETHNYTLWENAGFVSGTGNGKCSSHVNLAISCSFIADTNTLEVENVKSVVTAVFYRVKV